MPQTVPSLSLIVATVGRETELARCLSSLAAQSRQAFEVVLVDQNDDDRVAALLDRQRAPFPLVHVRTRPGLSHARNVGLTMAGGHIVGFPDDDCWYDADTVARVLQFFAGRPDAQGLSGGG
ncbi:MAG: glycosyltransferase family A protein, partial [Steroidobacterales bacterium]